MYDNVLKEGSLGACDCLTMFESALIESGSKSRQEDKSYHYNHQSQIIFLQPSSQFIVQIFLNNHNIAKAQPSAQPIHKPVRLQSNQKHRIVPLPIPTRQKLQMQTFKMTMCMLSALRTEARVIWKKSRKIIRKRIYQSQRSLFMTGFQCVKKFSQYYQQLMSSITITAATHKLIKAPMKALRRAEASLCQEMLLEITFTIECEMPTSAKKMASKVFAIDI